jgi:hypothetical protein
VSARAALILGLALIAAALVHGGIWSAGNDFVMNRFTGEYEFVPADDEGDWDGGVAWHARHAGPMCALTALGTAGRFAPLRRRR